MKIHSTRVLLREQRGDEVWYTTADPDRFGIRLHWDEDGNLTSIEFPGVEQQIQHIVTPHEEDQVDSSETRLQPELVRGSKDRVRFLDWSGDIGVAPDGKVYFLQSETGGGEPKTFWAVGVEDQADCPYGFEGTRADARKVCEWDAWRRLVRDAR